MDNTDVQDRPAVGTAAPQSRAVAARSSDMQWLDTPREKLIPTLMHSLYPGAKPESVAAVLDYCEAAGLNVMLKPVHIVPMSVKDKATNRYVSIDQVMPGITHYRTQASRSGSYLGKSQPEYGPMVERSWDQYKLMVPEWCKVTVKRLVQGQVAEFTAMEFWDENYATAGNDTTVPNKMWKKRPAGQLHKCTEAQALRMAFPELLGGETAEEMEGKFIDLTEDEIARKPAAVRSLDQFAGEEQVGIAGSAAAAKAEPEDAEVEEITEVDATPGMPDDAFNAFYQPAEGKQADWRPGWKWINDTLGGDTHYTAGVKQELAERYADLLWAVHDKGGPQSWAVLEFVEKHGMIVPVSAAPMGRGDAPAK